MGLATSSSSSSSIVAGSRDGNVLDYELREQKAQTLGNLDSQVERALAALRAFDAAPHGADGEGRRRALMDQAADRVWAFMIQRELCGFRNWEAVVKDYGIPRGVEPGWASHAQCGLDTAIRRRAASRARVAPNRFKNFEPNPTMPGGTSFAD